MYEKETEECPQCKKLIKLTEAVDHDSLCENCYWEED